MIRDLFLGFIRIHVLHHAAQQPVYGLWLIDELGHHGYRLGPGTLYPILRRLTEGGYLSADRRVVEGRARKYYTITPRGRRALVAARARLVELAGEVLEDRPLAAGRRGART